MKQPNIDIAYFVKDLTEIQKQKLKEVFNVEYINGERLVFNIEKEQWENNHELTYSYEHKNGNIGDVCARVLFSDTIRKGDLICPNGKDYSTFIESRRVENISIQDEYVDFYGDGSDFIVINRVYKLETSTNCVCQSRLKYTDITHYDNDFISIFLPRLALYDYANDNGKLIVVQESDLDNQDLIRVRPCELEKFILDNLINDLPNI